MVNIWKHKINDAKTRVLCKGLNHTVTPNERPIEEFVVATKQTYQFLPVDKAEHLKAQVTGILKSAKY